MISMTRTDDECYDPGKVSPVDRAMPREDDFGGIMYWADEGARPADQALVASPSSPQAVLTEGVDPSRDSPFRRFLTVQEAEAQGYTPEHILEGGRVRTMATRRGYSVVYGAPSYMGAVLRADIAIAIEAAQAGETAKHGSTGTAKARPVGIAQNKDGRLI